MHEANVETSARRDEAADAAPLRDHTPELFPDPASDDAGEPAHRPASESASESAPELAPVVEAMLFSTARPIAAARLAEAAAESGFGDPTADDVHAAVDALNAAYDNGGRAFRIERIAGGLRVMTRPAFAGALVTLHKQGPGPGLSRTAIETLAIIAYRQPITRASLEAVRGVGCAEVLRTLLDRGLIAVTGRAEEVGRPMLYGTTRKFLDAFGLASIKELPACAEAQPPTS